MICKSRLTNQDLIQKIFNAKPETRLSSIGIKKREINLFLKDLEEILDINIKGTDREEIITAQDLWTAAFIQII
jgi:hypothetical protein